MYIPTCRYITIIQLNSRAKLHIPGCKTIQVHFDVTFDKENMLYVRKILNMSVEHTTEEINNERIQVVWTRFHF